MTNRFSTDKLCDEFYLIQLFHPTVYWKIQAILGVFIQYECLESNGVLSKLFSQPDGLRRNSASIQPIGGWKSIHTQRTVSGANVETLMTYQSGLKKVGCFL